MSQVYSCLRDGTNILDSSGSACNDGWSRTRSWCMYSKSGCPPGTVLAVVKAFLDDSSDERKEWAWSVALYGLYESEWEGFDDSWSELLKRHGVPHLHMTDVAHFRGPYKRWQEEADGGGSKRRLFLQDVVGTIGDLDPLVVIGSVVYIKAFEDIGLQERIGDAYNFALMDCLCMAQSFVDNTSDVDRMQILVDPFDKPNKRIARAWEVGTETPTWIAPRSSALAVGPVTDAQKPVGLQPADFMAYEVRKAVFDSESNHSSNYPRYDLEERGRESAQFVARGTTRLRQSFTELARVGAKNVLSGRWDADRLQSWYQRDRERV